MENIANALRVLNLPDEFSKHNGVFTSEIQYSLVEKRINDFTKLVKGKPTITSTFEVRSKVFGSTGYVFNMLHDFIHFNNYDVVDTNTLKKDRVYGETFWYPEGNITISDNVITFVGNPFKNVLPNGQPEPTGGLNPSITILREDYVKTKSFFSTKPNKSYPSYTLDQIEALSGLTFDEICNAFRTEKLIWTPSGDTHVTSVGVKVDIADNTYTGKVYYNGIDTKEVKPSGLITSYGKVYPGHVTRWNLYNGDVNNSAYGSSIFIQDNSSEDTTITVVAGEKYSWDSLTRVLTFNANIPATLSFQYEELPAQGKNQSAMEIIQLS